MTIKQACFGNHVITLKCLKKKKKRVGIGLGGSGVEIFRTF